MILAIETAHAAKPDRTGVEEYCFQIIQHLKTVIPSDVRVVLYCKEQRTKNKAPASAQSRSRGEQIDLLRDLPANWEVKMLGWPLGKLWSQIRLSWELLWHPPDVFFAPGQLIPFFCPPHTVVMIHDSAFMVYPRAYLFWGRQYLKWMNRRILKNAALILTNSEFNRAELTRLYGNRVKSEIVVVPLAYDVKKYQVSSIKEQAPLNQQAVAKPYLISVGRLEEKKNTQSLIKAFNSIKYQESSIKYQALQLVLVGKPGAGYEKIKTEIGKSPYRADIIEVGYVASEDLPELLRNAEAFVFPSWYEGFGIPILEAMAVGCPVVCSGIPALREVGGGAVRYVPPEDIEALASAIKDILEQAEQRPALIAPGLARAASFSWAKTAGYTWSAIAKLRLI